jgi:peptide/nickel transport system permease protein
MINYIIRRVLYVIPITFGVALVTFFLFRVVGGNPAYLIAGKNATPEQIKEIEHELGYDKPLFLNFKALKELKLKKAFDSQFVFHFKQVITFNFGRSYRTKQRITEMLRQGIGPSLSLAVPAFFTGVFIAISISLFCAFYWGTFIDRIIVVLSVIGMSIPFLAFIIGGQYLLAYKAGLFEISGFEPGLGSIKYIILPALIWVISALGGDVRFFRTVMLDEIRQDYVRTAQAKGLERSAILFKHVLKNAMIPIITRLVIAIPFLYTGSLLLENFFGIPGLGNMGIIAIANSDWPVINALTFIGAVLFILGNLASDVCYALVDPRVKLG